MKIFRGFKLGARSDVESPLRSLLPEVNGFVDVRLGDDPQRHSIPIDDIGADRLTTRALPGLEIGVTADFLYSNPAGRFRFATVCVAVDAHQAHFKTPASVQTLTTYGAKRSAVRLDATLPMVWRYAPGGVGNGEFVKGSMTDVSRGGASLVVAREIKPGTLLELRLTLKAGESPLTLLAEVLRAGRIETSDKYFAGIRFSNISHDEELAIHDFINERQTDRRERGVI